MIGRPPAHPECRLRPGQNRRSLSPPEIHWAVRCVTHRLWRCLLASPPFPPIMIAGALKQLFGKAIRSKRSELGISQEELADRAGLHRTYISDVERGARNLSLESIEKLAH